MLKTLLMIYIQQTDKLVFTNFPEDILQRLDNWSEISKGSLDCHQKNIQTLFVFRMH